MTRNHITNEPTGAQRQVIIRIEASIDTCDLERIPGNDDEHEDGGPRTRRHILADYIKAQVYRDAEWNCVPVSLRVIESNGSAGS